MEEHFGVLEPPEMEPFQKGSVIAYAYYRYILLIHLHLLIKQS